MNFRIKPTFSQHESIVNKSYKMMSTYSLFTWVNKHVQRFILQFTVWFYSLYITNTYIFFFFKISSCGIISLKLLNSNNLAPTNVEVICAGSLNIEIIVKWTPESKAHSVVKVLEFIFNKNYKMVSTHSLFVWVNKHMQRLISSAYTFIFLSCTYSRLKDE